MAQDVDIRRDGVWPARSAGVGILAALDGAALTLWPLVATPLIRGRRLRSGKLGTEATNPLPSDEVVPEPTWSYTLAISVDAAPEAVWPWIAQVGQGSRGFPHLSDAQEPRRLQDHQHDGDPDRTQQPVVGNDIYLYPTAPPIRAEVVDAPNALVLAGSIADIGGGMSTWLTPPGEAEYVGYDGSIGSQLIDWGNPRHGYRCVCTVDTPAEASQ